MTNIDANTSPPARPWLSGLPPLAPPPGILGYRPASPAQSAGCRPDPPAWNVGSAQPTGLECGRAQAPPAMWAVARAASSAIAGIGSPNLGHAPAHGFEGLVRAKGCTSRRRGVEVGPPPGSLSGPGTGAQGGLMEPAAEGAGARGARCREGGTPPRRRASHRASSARAAI